ncbi:MAG: hypothetical protein JO247_03855 [Chloroflexi bacterium]|nr:hypothetical protein [Chloroflexota bacterium]
MFVAAAAATLALAGCGVSGRRQPRIGFIGAVPNVSGLATFKRALADNGYLEGKSYQIIERYVGETGDGYDQLADDMVQQQVDVVASTFDHPSAMSRLNPLPVVVIGAASPVASGLAESLQNPGGNLTGVLARPTTGLLRVHLALLLDLIPNLRRVTFVPPFVAGGQIAGEPQFAVPSAAGMTGVQVHVVPNRPGVVLNNPSTLFTDQNMAGAEVAIIAVASPRPDQVAQLAAARKLPVLYQGNFDYARKNGGLMSQGVDVDDVFRRAGAQTAKILDGAKAGSLPIEEPDKIDLVINMSAAQGLGLTVPTTVLNQATEVIP